MGTERVAEHQRPERSCHESIHYTFAGENPQKDQCRVSFDDTPSTTRKRASMSFIFINGQVAKPPAV
ncbi:hypothetical protein PsorP6_015420 [Peronosclerospora sorghi]|uniref:Uncharacterized protein n=1 Tax=Peronosclerospora sorghi TaxID=230839 RepID=A0ACC0WQ85_9STRA|nr:hypothetical protein PsorP6_015420 [Peronosclerospora sorghi]